MKKTILVDIGIIAEYLKTGKGILPTAYEKFKMSIASSTYVELLASVTFKDAVLEKEVMDFVKKYFSVVNIDEKVALEAAKIVREKNVNLASALVAATAKVNSYDLLTKNKKTFGVIDGVNLLEL